MSPAGATAALAAAPPDAAIVTHAGPGSLTRPVERREGALRRPIARHEIVVLEKSEWDRKKASLGERIWS